ncbi:MAG TPA: alkaline phosphatase family protein, partial [Solirubrobacterales bacterium]|nr:alkaline phosphatase family protein [Solirubrobacterales bacterium]
MRIRLLLLVTALLVTALATSAHAAELPHIKHLFVIVEENENAEESFSADPPAPYLGKTMVEEGALLPNYFGIGHQSLDNYLALVSGQPPNLATQTDCLIYTDMLAPGTEPDGVAVGQGCVFPASVQTIAGQLEETGHTWRSYNQDMAAGAKEGEATTCRHPSIGSYDQTQVASATNQYAARHDPFVYFHSITDSETCNRNVVDLTRLPEDLESLATSPEYAFITPDLCYDGHDATCADGVSPGGYMGINAFLEEWVPRIKASPAYRDHGAIMVTFDESETGAESCCDEPLGPNTLNNGGIMPGNGGGRVGAVIESPCIKAGTISLDNYNHYSALRWIEDNWGLSHLADASTDGLRPFGSDVFTNPACDTGLATGSGGGRGGGGGGSGGGRSIPEPRPATHLGITPRHVPAGKLALLTLSLSSDIATCRAGAPVHIDGHKTHTSRKGIARIKARLPEGRWTAVARPPGCKAAKAFVH